MELNAVVIVSDALHVDGGSAKVALSSAVALAEAGYHVTAFGAIGPVDPGVAATAGIDVVCTDQAPIAAAGGRAAIRGIWNAPAHAAMRECLSGLDPERTIVHLHGWTKALSSSVIHAALQARFSVVVTVHEYFTVCPTGSLFWHKEREICRLQPMSAACIAHDCDSRSYAHKLWRVARQLVQQYVAHVPAEVSQFVTISRFSRDVIAPMLSSSAVLHYVPNPVEAIPGERVAAEGNAAFAFVGRLSPEKGPALFAEAAKRAGVPALFIGDGDERAAVLAANPEAVVTGWLSHPETIAMLRTVRVLVLPSLWYETLGLTVLEAAALGIPAVVPTECAAGESIDPGVTGLRFATGDCDDLAAQLAAFRDDAVVQRMGSAAHARYWANPYTMTRHVSGLLETYDSVLRDRASRRTPSQLQLDSRGVA
jgi:glycosyltransferase involved in cell wall biosynthesis